MAVEYDIDELAKCWGGIRQAYFAYRGAGSDPKHRQHCHDRLIRQLEYFFATYPNPFGDDQEFIRLQLEDNQLRDVNSVGTVKSKMEEAAALLKDIDRTIEHHRESGDAAEKLENLRQLRRKAAAKFEHFRSEYHQQGLASENS